MRNGRSIRIRRGVDKVVLSVTPEKFIDVKYDRTIALNHKDKYKRMKFGRREWGGVIYFPVGVWDDTPLIQYFVPLKGQLRVVIVMNMMRYYNYEHDLEPPRRIALWDNNIVDPSVQFELSWFLSALSQLRKRFIEDAKKLVEYVFEGRYVLERPLLTVNQMELPEEAIGLDMIDIKQVYKHTRAMKVERWSHSTGTVYLNGPNKTQVKFYQKGIGVLRCEWTINEGSIMMDLSDPRQVESSIDVGLYHIASEIGINRKWWDLVRWPEKEELWEYLSCTLGVELNLLKRVCQSDTWYGTKDNELVTRKLLRRGLIVKIAHGKYAPSRKLRMFVDMLDTLREPL